MELQGRVTGIQQLNKTFTRLPRSMQRKAYRQALRSGAAPVRDAAQVNIREVSEPFTGLARKRGTIRIYNLRKYRGNFRVAVQVKRGLTNAAKRDKEGKPVRVGMYLAVMEYGSQKLNRRPRSWIRKAIREQKNKAVEALRKEMSKRIVDALTDAKMG